LGQGVKLVAVVLNWKRPEETIACVTSIRETAPDAQIVVVDNASADGSVEKIRRAHLGIAVVENFENLGYAGGNNIGIKVALERGADAVLILNNDVIVQPGCVQTLVAKLREHPEWGIVAPLSLKADDPGVVDFYRAQIDAKNFAVHAIARDTRALPTEDAETDYATGSAMLIRSQVLRDIGLLEEKFFLVWEDVEFCVRARVWGSKVGVTPSARVLHGRSVTFGGENSPLYQYFFVRNSFLLVRTHPQMFPERKRVLRPPVHPLELLERRYRGWLDKPETTPELRKAIARGLDDGLAGRFGPPPIDRDF
jgi:GT2 family glycosyltransferase